MDFKNTKSKNYQKNYKNKIYNFKEFKNKNSINNNILQMFSDFNNNAYDIDYSISNKDKSCKTINSLNEEEKCNQLSIIYEVSSNISLISFIKLQNNDVKLKIIINKYNNLIIECKNCNEIINSLKLKLCKYLNDNFEIEIVLLVIIKKLKSINFVDSNEYYDQYLNDLINN